MSKRTMPKRATGVHSRVGSTIWQWRIKTPKDLQHIYPTEYAYRCSLGTSSLVEANVKAARLYADWLAEFDKQRQEALAPNAAPEIAPEWIEYMSAKLVHDTLAADEEMRSPKGLKELAPYGDGIAEAVQHLSPIDGMPPAFAKAIALNNLETLSDLRDQMRRRDVKPLFQWLRSLGAEFDENTPNIRQFLDHYLKAAVQAAEMKVQRDKGEIVETPPLPTPREPSKVYRLRDVFDKWKEAEGHTISKDARQARERALCLYEEFSGDPPITDITRAQGSDFRAWLLKNSRASKTARDRFIYVKALFAFAYRELELIPRHPWDRMVIESTTENKRKPWSPDQIQSFFTLPLFTSYTLPKSKRAGADAAYWIPLLGLFTGARSAELCQLQVADIVQEQGVFALDINEAEDGKRLKTDASWRKVPIHSELIRLGFLDYVQDMKEAGHASLWPSLHLNPKKPSHGFSLWFNQDPYRKPLGDNFPDFHALRHTVRSAMSDANVSEPDQDNITGHATQGSTGTRVYRHVKLVKLRQGIEAIHYPTFNLARTYPSHAKETAPTSTTAHLSVDISTA